MATIKYSYPRVDITVKALIRKPAAVAESTATTLLAPFVSDRGPENVLLPVDTYADFTSYFGTLDYSRPSQRQILNIGKWLENGGRVMACRITKADATVSLHAVQAITNGTNTINNYFWRVGTTDASTAAVTASIVQGSITPANKFIKLDVTHYGETSVSRTVYLALSNNTAAYSQGTETSYALFNNLSTADLSGLTTTLTTSFYVSVLSSGVLTITYDGTTVYPFKTDVVFPVIPSAKDLDSVNYSDAVKAYGQCQPWSAFGVYAQAKYTGSFYNGKSIALTAHVISDTQLSFDIVVEDNDSTVLEKYSNVPFDGMTSALADSLYVGAMYLYDAAGDTTVPLTALTAQYTGGIDETVGTIVFANGTDFLSSVDEKAYTSLSANKFISTFVPTLRSILAKPLETPFDTFIDCGYPLAQKKDLIKLFCAIPVTINDVCRNDAFLAISPYVVSGNGKNDTASPTVYNSIVDVSAGLAAIRTSAETIDSVACDFFNMAIFSQYEKDQDSYSSGAGADVFFPSTYFLAGLYPYNDMTYGPQYTTAGQTRGKISYTSINTLPTNAEKENLYNAHFNYIEKDSRGSYIMAERTGTTKNTALEAIHSTRALLRIKKDLTLIAREYLFEFNDTVTKQNLTNALNGYIADWIQNRTLTEGYVSVIDSNDDPTLTSKQIGINLTIKFIDAINIISTTIVVE